jgi:hypothetical protein
MEGNQCKDRYLAGGNRRTGEEIVLLQIATGQELGRVRSGGLMQGVVFPSVGWDRDFYWASMGKLARVFVQG